MCARNRAIFVIFAVAVALSVTVAPGALAKPTKAQGRPWRTEITMAPTSSTSSTTSTTATAAPTPTTVAASPSTTLAPTTTTTSTTVPAPAPAPTTTRSAAAWPFSATSPWNLGVGSGAQFESATAPRTASLLSTAATPWVNAGQYSHPVVQARDTDPLATVTKTSTGARWTYRIPDAARPAGGTDEHLHVVEPGGRYVHEAWNMVGANPTWTVGHLVRTDLQSSGMGAGGVRAYGGSALGGLIRSWELEQGSIRHALALALTDSQLKVGWVWPATTQDGNATSTYHGQVPMGTFVAIPPSVDVAGLGLSADGRAVARALQNYGAYVVDRSGSFTLFAEPTASYSRVTAIRNDMAKLRSQLRVVTNNSPTSVNGGGTPRVAPAPAFAP